MPGCAPSSAVAMMKAPQKTVPPCCPSEDFRTTIGKAPGKFEVREQFAACLSTVQVHGKRHLEHYRRSMRRE